MNKNGLIDPATMAAALNSVAAVVPVVEAVKPSLLKQAAKYTGAILLIVPVASLLFPQYAVVFKGLAAFLQALGSVA